MDNKEAYTSSQIKYIICIQRLSREGYGVKNVELACALELSKPSVHNMLRSLVELGIVKQESFGLAYFTEKGRMLAHKYTACYEELDKRISELCGGGAASEQAICSLLADMPQDRLDSLYDLAIKRNEE